MGSAQPVGREREITLPGREHAVIQEIPGPPGASTLMLLHGLALNAELNWSGVIPTLARHYRVLALDLPGHARGSRRPAPFRLEDCADDIAKIAAALGIPRLVAVGYSLGGMIAQLLWRRHPELTAGLVLCSTARNVSGTMWERVAALAMPSLVAAATWNPALYLMRADIVGASLIEGVADPIARRWAEQQIRRTALLDALPALQAACQFTSHEWIGSVEVPTAVVITGRDRIVPARRQWKLANAIPNSVVHEIEAGHAVFLEAPGTFAAVLLNACASVTGGDVSGPAESVS
jgi:pimeloyl-ACP methyl ester carboxylesterase